MNKKFEFGKRYNVWFFFFVAAFMLAIWCAANGFSSFIIPLIYSAELERQAFNADFNEGI